jgi:hypothetical protein
MMLAEHLPDPEKLSQMIGNLLEMETGIAPGKALQLPAPGDPVLVATYESDEAKVAGLCLCDVQAANRLGAALSMIPADVANKNIKARQVTDDIKVNINDLMTAIGHFLNNKYLPNLKLKAVQSSQESLPESVTTLAQSPAARLDLEVKLPNYGSGYLSIILDELPVTETAPDQA